MHRYIYQECFGEIPEGMVVRHLCNNPSCINPEHLKIGTPYDNVQDRVKANRSAIGINNGRSKLTEEDVVKIKRDSIHSKTDLAIIYDVTSKVIDNIKNNKNWKHINVKIEPAPSGINKGSKVKTSKLTEDDVVVIKQLLEQNYGVRELGRMFGVSHPQISLIKNNKAWIHVN
jgi:hypothetical protein